MNILTFVKNKMVHERAYHMRGKTLVSVFDTHSMGFVVI